MIKKICRYCNKEITANKLERHEEKCSRPKKKGHRGNPGHRGGNQYTKAAELGLPKPEVSEETRERARERMLGLANPSLRSEVKEKISKTCLERSKAGEWHTSVAKRMHYTYNSEDYHGKWEYAFAQLSDRDQLGWQRNKNRFAYEFGGKIRYYTPDFVRGEEYLEIKGFETEKDQAKWKQFPHKLEVVRYEDLKKMVNKYPDLDSLVVG